MDTEARERLEHVRDAAQNILKWTAGWDLARYSADDRLPWACERGFIIIGDALDVLRRIDAATAARVTNVEQFVALRDALLDYDTVVENRELWDVIADDLGRLLTEVDALLCEAD